MWLLTMRTEKKSKWHQRKIITLLSSCDVVHSCILCSPSKLCTNNVTHSPHIICRPISAHCRFSEGVDVAESETSMSTTATKSTYNPSSINNSYRIPGMAPPGYIEPPSFEATLRARSASMSALEKHIAIGGSERTHTHTCKHTHTRTYTLQCEHT